MPTVEEKRDFIRYIRFMEREGYSLFKYHSLESREQQVLIKLSKSIDVFLQGLPDRTERLAYIRYLEDRFGEGSPTRRDLRQHCIELGLTNG